MPRGVQGISS